MDGALRRHVLRRWGTLKSERSEWDGHWREIAENLLPRSSRFSPQDRNRLRRHKIYDNTAMRSLDVLSAGLMGGLTAPSLPWFLLSVAD